MTVLSFESARMKWIFVEGHLLHHYTPQLAKTPKNVVMSTSLWSWISWFLFTDLSKSGREKQSCLGAESLCLQRFVGSSSRQIMPKGVSRPLLGQLRGLIPATRQLLTTPALNGTTAPVAEASLLLKGRPALPNSKWPCRAQTTALFMKFYKLVSIVFVYRAIRPLLR